MRDAAAARAPDGEARCSVSMVARLFSNVGLAFSDKRKSASAATRRALFTQATGKSGKYELTCQC
jgi:hypothetical protein